MITKNDTQVCVRIYSSVPQETLPITKNLEKYYKNKQDARKSIQEKPKQILKPMLNICPPLAIQKETRLTLL